MMIMIVVAGWDLRNWKKEKALSTDDPIMTIITMIMIKKTTLIMITNRDLRKWRKERFSLMIMMTITIMKKKWWWWGRFDNLLAWYPWRLIRIPKGEDRERISDNVIDNANDYDDFDFNTPLKFRIMSHSWLLIRRTHRVALNQSFLRREKKEGGGILLHNEPPLLNKLSTCYHIYGWCGARFLSLRDDASAQ